MRFAEALRPRVMGPRLAAALRGDTRTCHVLDAKYEPGKRALVLYDYGGRLVRGDLLPAAGDPASDSAASDSTAYDSTAYDSTAVVEPGVRLSVFPHDPDLPSLPRALDPGTYATVLGANDGARTGTCRVRLLRYRPGKRVTVYVWRRSGSGAEGYVAKVYHDPGKAEAVAAEAKALDGGRRPAGVLRLAAPVAHVRDLALLVQRAVRGVPLDQLVTGGLGRAEAGIGLAARALAELHDRPVISGRERPVDRELRRFGARAARIAEVNPALGAALTALADRLIRLQPSITPGPAGLVHGDCKPSQFMVAKDHVFLLDLDHCGVADPASDLGTFLATLRQHRARHRLAGTDRPPAWQWIALGERFLTTYLTVRREPSLRSAARWYEAVALERKALRCFARAPRSPLAGVLVSEAQLCLDRLEGGEER